MPPSGVLELTLGVGAPPTPLDSVTLSVQGLFLAAGEVFDGGITTIAILGSGL